MNHQPRSWGKATINRVVYCRMLIRYNMQRRFSGQRKQRKQSWTFQNWKFLWRSELLKKKTSHNTHQLKHIIIEEQLRPIIVFKRPGVESLKIKFLLINLPIPFYTLKQKYSIWKFCVCVRMFFVVWLCWCELISINPCRWM